MLLVPFESPWGYGSMVPQWGHKIAKRAGPQNAGECDIHVLGLGLVVLLNFVGDWAARGSLDPTNTFHNQAQLISIRRHRRRSVANVVVASLFLGRVTSLS